jgi:Leucine-rich repeat (LRR) protein
MAMKPLIFILLGTAYLCGGCSQGVPLRYEFHEVLLGGPDVHGELYRKKYFSEEDRPFTYNRWPGYVVKSNEELEALYKAHPDCQAIHFDYWTQDGTDTTTFQLSEVIGEFRNLKFLEIASNRIKGYPRSIEKLTALEELVIQLLNKDSIEFSFAPFSKLKHLTIHFADDLKTFPVSIYELNQLVSLKLFRFFIVPNKVLNGLENLESLQELYIWDSNLQLPPGYRGTKKLHTLILDQGPNRVDPGVFEITSLKRLGLTRADTLDLAALSRLENLEALSLSYNSLYENKPDLPKLEHLSITSFQGNQLSIGIAALPRVESLVIWDCDNLTTLDNFSAPSLRSITINANEKLRRIHFDEPHLQNLEEVIVKYNPILKLPSDSIHGVAVDVNTD